MHTEAGPAIAGSGAALMVIARDDVGPWNVEQLKFVPYTWIFPDVAFDAKFTVIKASVGLICIIVAPVPV